MGGKACPNCGTELLEDSVFCTKCGINLGISKSEQIPKKKRVKKIVGKSVLIFALLIVVFLGFNIFQASRLKEELKRDWLTVEGDDSAILLMPMVALHWEKYFQHICEKYNSIYRVQMPKVTPHVCRHTYCSHMASSGFNPKHLQYLMGHSDIGVTLNTYTHVDFDNVEKEVKGLKKVVL